MNLKDLHKLSTKREKALNANGIYTPADLVMSFPRRYLDKSAIVSIVMLRETGDPVSVVGKVTSVNVTGFKSSKRLEVIVTDQTGSMKAVWFKGWKYFITQFKEGNWVSLFGKAKQYGRNISMAHPDVEQLESRDELQKFDKLIPVYPSNKDFSKAYISNKIFSSWIKEVLQNCSFEEFLPEDILKRYHFPGRHQALHDIHQPSVRKDADHALERFKYEEFFLFELSMAKIKMEQQQKMKGAVCKPGKLTKQFFNDELPFELTDGQKKALSDIRNDLDSGWQMNRLLQGDVGAGKTIVAIGAMLMALDSGYQASLMAPTEILAEQHFFTLQSFLEPLSIQIRLLKGGQKKSLRQDILSDIESGRCQIVTGTHAIIQESVHFRNHKLAVIDEQHRFGVKQRHQILQKGDDPHLLVMSATPIPRSLAMTLYSDLDISVIKDLPEGRKPIKTAVRTEKDRESVYSFIDQIVREGGQVYVVYPLIEESEVLDLKNATDGFEKLKRRFPDVHIALLHGRLSSEEKETAMAGFTSGEVKILVSTTVIEVGVDVPNATVMVVEQAERFGLSQLHQLRGRIGRGRSQSYCILIPGQRLSADGRTRLRTLVQTNNGFDIAEADLKLRGPGDFLGTRQSGLPEFRYASIMDDRLLLEQAKNDSWQLIKQDLNLNSNPKLQKVFKNYFSKRKELFGIG